MNDISYYVLKHKTNYVFMARDYSGHFGNYLNMIYHIRSGVKIDSKYVLP